MRDVSEGKEECEFLADLKRFIEQGGKPCCLNLVTEEDNKFLKRLEKEKKAAEDKAALKAA